MKSSAAFDAQQFRYGVALDVLESLGTLDGVRHDMTTAEVCACM
jgi:hypothetical protein